MEQIPHDGAEPSQHEHPLTLSAGVTEQRFTKIARLIRAESRLESTVSPLHAPAHPRSRLVPRTLRALARVRAADSLASRMKRTDAMQCLPVRGVHHTRIARCGRAVAPHGWKEVAPIRRVARTWRVRVERLCGASAGSWLTNDFSVLIRKYYQICLGFHTFGAERQCHK